MTEREGPRSLRPIDAAMAALVVLAAIAFALIRVQAVNLPWHLATARLAQETGRWPAVNTFSYTFPEHPVFQQYPAFQATAWRVLAVAGWGGLSVMTALGWIVAFLLMVRWGGPFAAAPRFHVLWMLGLCALQRRMVLRPDMFTMLALGAELLALDALARGRKGAVAAVPLIHLFWVNSHQLFPLSFVVQGIFLVERVARRDRTGARLAALALAASIALSFATPLGWRIVLAPLRTARSLAVFRGNVAEFQHVWRLPLELTLMLATGVPAAWALWRARRGTSPFELGVWLLSLAMVLSAVRGLMFFGVVSCAVFQRCATRTWAAGGTLLPPVSDGTRRTLRALGLAFTAVLAGAAVFYRWISPPLTLGGTQPGLGRAIGGWSEEATAFLRANPPPGRMINIQHGLGDNLIFWAPGLPVFVDSRLESYPVDFLREIVAAEQSDAAFAALAARYRADWAFVDHTRPSARARALALLRAGWGPVYVDSAHLVLVRPSEATRAYLRAHAVDPRRAQPLDLVDAPADLRQQQLASFERLRAVLP